MSKSEWYEQLYRLIQEERDETIRREEQFLQECFDVGFLPPVAANLLGKGADLCQSAQ